MERRVYLRYNTEDKYWANLSTEEVEKVKIRNMSSGGICLHTTKNLPVNQLINIEIYSGNEEKTIMKCEVAWSSLLREVQEKKNSYSVYEIGLKFIEISDIQKKFIETFENTATKLSFSEI